MCASVRCSAFVRADMLMCSISKSRAVCLFQAGVLFDSS